MNYFEKIYHTWCSSFIPIPLCIILIIFPGLPATGQGLAAYGPIPDFEGYTSSLYACEVRTVDAAGQPTTSYAYSHTYYLASPEERQSHSHWTTFSFGPEGSAARVEVRVTLQSGNINTYEFRPSHVSHVNISGGSITFQIASDKYTSLIINGDIRNPLFIFSDPAETNVPDSSGTDVYVVARGSNSKNDPLTIRDIGNKKIIYFEPGEHWINEADSHGYTPQSSNLAFFITKNDGTRVEGNQLQQIYIPAQTIVHGNIRATRITGLMVNGRGIIEGEDTYGYSSGDYYSSQILSSAINMAAYKDQSVSQIPDMDQVVDGITSILSRKYHFQLGTGALIRNTKCFAHHQTTDGIGIEANSQAMNNFIKTNDDALKLYQDNTTFENTYIWHQMNGSAMQLGWDKEEGDNILVKNTYILHDDMFQAGYFNEGFWANQSIVSWLKHNPAPDNDIKENIVIDGINQKDMPLVGMVRVLAIAMDGNLGGSGAGSIELTMKNVVCGPENVKTPSYVGAADGHYSKVHFINCSRDGICMEESNVPARGNVAGVSITSNYCVDNCGENTPPRVTLSADSASINYGSAITLTAEPEDDDGNLMKVEFFHGTDLLQTLVAAPWTLSIPKLPVGNHTFSAVATDSCDAETTSSPVSVTVTGDNFTITATSGENGQIEPSGTITVPEGNDQAFSFVPDEGYIVSGIMVDGTPYVAADSYTFKVVQSDHAIHVSFEKIPPRSAYQTFNAVDNDAESAGLQHSTWCTPHIGQVNGGEWIMFNELDFKSKPDIRFTARATAGYPQTGSIEVRLDATDGTLAGQVNVPNTGGWCNYMDFSTDITGADGIHDVYIVFKGTNDFLDLATFTFDLINHQEGGLETSPISIYPNPAGDRIRIDLRNIQRQARITIFNTSGAILYENHDCCRIIEIPSTEINQKGLVFLKILNDHSFQIFRLMIL